jgi:hypothetical protein
MFRAVRHSSSGALTVFAVSSLHTHVVTGCSQVWVGTGQFPLRFDYGRSPHAYVNQRLQIQLELLMMSAVPLEICWAFNGRWNNKFCYKVASFWLFILRKGMSYIQKKWSGVKCTIHILSRNYLLKDNTNLLKTKHNLFYIRNQSVARCKHFPPRL